MSSATAVNSEALNQAENIISFHFAISSGHQQVKINVSQRYSVGGGGEIENALYYM